MKSNFTGLKRSANAADHAGKKSKFDCSSGEGRGVGRGGGMLSTFFRITTVLDSAPPLN